MKHLFLSLAALLAFSSMSLAEETIGQKIDRGAEATSEKSKEITAETRKAGRKTKRMAKKGWNRTKEAVCAEGDTECEARRAQHRAEEARERANDKTKDTTHE